MSDRITRENVDERCANVNRRMESRGSIVRYAVEGRNGYIGLDRMHVELVGRPRVGRRDEQWKVQATVTVGTKREVADFLHAMMVALDDSAMEAGVDEVSAENRNLSEAWTKDAVPAGP